MSFYPIRVTVPGTTSNLGPGFDALGLALALHNEVVVDHSATGRLAIEIFGEGADTLPRDEHNLLVVAIDRACEAAGIARPPITLRCTHLVPTARGLGSSAAAVVAGLLIGDALAHGALGRENLLEIATRMEGHPDNAAPALFGGLQATVVASDGRVHRANVPLGLVPHVALFVPTFEIATREARSVLPETLTRAEAVHNITRTALLVAALAGHEPRALAVATEDVLHQPARTALFPQMPEILAAARTAGALGAFLSGSGSTLAAFADANHVQRVADAMHDRARALGVDGRAVTTTIETHGARVLTG